MASTVKYQIFISSTWKDLRDYRKGVIEQILEQEHIPSGMESFSAGTEEDFAVIKKAIDQCDVYIVLIGACFGSPFRGTRTSFTQQEVRYARDKGKPILAFLLDDTEFKKERKRFDRQLKFKTEEDRSRAEHERQFHTELLKFREEVKELDAKNGTHRIVSPFSSIEDLKCKFLTAFEKLIHNPGFNTPGWHRFSTEVGKNTFIQNIVGKLSDFDKLSERCVSGRANLKALMATYFWDEFKFDIVKAGVKHLFFESGSTIAFVSSAFCESLKADTHKKDWRIRTNNILSYLEFVLLEHANVHADLYPHGPPDRTYGATFGLLKEEEKQGYPDHNVALSESDREALYSVKAMANQILPSDKPALILGTASGVELRANNEFQGPHVGTYYNKLFKRALLESRHPIVLFLDEEKFSLMSKTGNFKVGYCHHVCDADIPWDRVCSTWPLGLCIGASSRVKSDRIIEYFAKLGFKRRILTKQYGDNYVTLIANKVFTEGLGRVLPASRSTEKLCP